VCPKSPECPKLPEAPESPDCKGEKLSDLSDYQKLANIQYQRDVKGVWISDTKLKYQDADENIKIFNSDDEKSTEFITFQTLNGYKKLELTDDDAYYVNGQKTQLQKGCYEKDNLYESPHGYFICFGECKSSESGYNVCQDPKSKSADNFIREGGNVSIIPCSSDSFTNLEFRI
jgi:hypothetical protein